MKVFETRIGNLKKYLAGRIELFQLTRSVHDLLPSIRNKSNDPVDDAYANYLRYLCVIEKRAENESHLRKYGLVIKGAFGNVGRIYLKKMSLEVKKVLSYLGKDSVKQVFRGPKGVMILEIEGSPIGKVFISSAIYKELRLSNPVRPPIKSTYIDRVFAFSIDYPDQITY